MRAWLAPLGLLTRPHVVQTILHSFAGLLPFFLPWQNGGRADVEFLRREYGDMQVPVSTALSLGGLSLRKRALHTYAVGRTSSVHFASLCALFIKRQQLGEFDFSNSSPGLSPNRSIRDALHLHFPTCKLCTRWTTAAKSAGSGMLLLRRVRRRTTHIYDTA